MSRHNKITEGSVIEGRYEIISKLGSGGFGTVYKARQLSTGQLVAIKMMHMSRMPTANSEIVAGRFEREMRLIAQLKHPNVVRLIDTGKTDKGVPFNVLELIEGQPLDEYIKENGPLDVRKAQHLMFQVLDALSAAHEAGVVHRDLKPSNIMVTTTGYRPNATVLDFGLSAVMEAARPADYVELTAQLDSNMGYAGGTPSYVAPEMLQKNLSTPQCDVYAWGLVFLECMTGSKVVDGPTEIAILMRQGSPEPVPIPDIQLPPVLRAVISRAVAKPLEIRYTSATEVIQDHEAMASGAAPLPNPDLRASQLFAPSFAEADPTDQMPFTQDDLKALTEAAATDPDAIRRSFNIPTTQNPVLQRDKKAAPPAPNPLHEASTRDLPAVPDAPPPSEPPTAPEPQDDDSPRLPLAGVLIVAICVGLAIWIGVQFIAKRSKRPKAPPIQAERVEEADDADAASTTPTAPAPEDDAGSEPAAQDDGPIACEDRAACASLGDAAICGPDKTCVLATSERCDIHHGPLGDKDTLLIGSIAKRSAEGDSGFGITHAIALAVSELNRAEGLPYKLVHVGCDSGGTGEGATEAARHLIDTLGVHAIIGPGRSTAFVEVSALAARKGVMLLSPSATSPVLSGLQDKGLGWRTAASDRHQAVALADLLIQRKHVRVAALAFDDVYARALLDNIRAHYDSATNTKDAIYARVYKDTTEKELQDAVADVTAQVPRAQAVLVLGHEEVAQVIKAHHEASGKKLAHYVVSEGGRKDPTRMLPTELPRLAGLIEGVENIHMNGELFQRFAARYQEQHKAAPPVHAANAYDAVYLLAYASLPAEGEAAPTGPHVAKAMARVTSQGCEPAECRVEVGPKDISIALERLHNDQAINLDGASGALDFDLDTGDVSADVGLWSITKANPGVFTRIGVYSQHDDGEWQWSFTR